jgi:hypothetical protein
MVYWRLNPGGAALARQAYNDPYSVDLTCHQCNQAQATIRYSVREGTDKIEVWFVCQPCHEDQLHNTHDWSPTPILPKTIQFTSGLI